MYPISNSKTHIETYVWTWLNRQINKKYYPKLPTYLLVCPRQNIDIKSQRRQGSVDRGDGIGWWFGVNQPPRKLASAINLISQSSSSLVGFGASIRWLDVTCVGSNNMITYVSNTMRKLKKLCNRKWMVTAIILLIFWVSIHNLNIYVEIRTLRCGIQLGMSIYFF